jgi:threonine dehydratase
MEAHSRSDSVTLADVERARDAIEGLVTRTPTLRVARIDEVCQGSIALKAESLQASGSFKLRGASAKLRSSAAACERGVVAGTAGNHGQAVALAARRQGVSCDLFVPVDAPVSKTVPAALLGASLHPCEGSVDECIEDARRFAERAGVEMVHPFDDPEVIAGQGTVGLELTQDTEDLRKVIVPLGGGGLAAGVAIAVKTERPDTEVVGVQVEACASYPGSLAAGKPVPCASGQTVADGIAVKRPGAVTLPLIDAWLDRVAVVGEDEVGDAMALLLGEGKLVVEGAGAVGIAALLGGHEPPAVDGTTAVILSGGNIDEELLIAVARRSETQHGRGVVLFTTISDRPGSLARLLERVARAGANVVDVRHIREGVSLGISETGVELILETRGTEHAEEIVASLTEHGYHVHEVMHPDEEAR